MSSLTPVAHDLDHRWHYLASEQLQHECPAWSTAHSSFCTHLTCIAICQWLSALCTVAVERPFFPVSTERRSLVRDHQITISVYRLVFAPIINSCRLCFVQEAFCMHVVDLYFLQLVHVVHCISFSAYEWARLVSSAIYNILGLCSWVMSMPCKGDGLSRHIFEMSDNFFCGQVGRFHIFQRHSPFLPEILSAFLWCWCNYVQWIFLVNRPHSSFYEVAVTAYLSTITWRGWLHMWNMDFNIFPKWKLELLLHCSCVSLEHFIP